MNHDDVIDGNVKEFGQIGNWATAGIHKRKRFGEDYFWSTDAKASLGDDRIRFVRFEADSHALSKNIEHHLPNIVPIGRVAGPGVTEPDY